MSHVSTPDSQPRSWESSPTLIPQSLSSRSCSSFDQDDSDIEERKGFLSPMKSSPPRRYMRKTSRVLLYLIVAALLLIWKFKPATNPRLALRPHFSHWHTNHTTKDRHTDNPLEIQQQADIIPETLTGVEHRNRITEIFTGIPQKDDNVNEIQPIEVPVVEIEHITENQEAVQIHEVLQKGDYTEVQQPPPNAETQLVDATATNRHIDHYMDDIGRFFADVRLDNPDGLAFAQMGFRTRLYASMLRNEDLNSTGFLERERGLWFFAPGIETIRKRAQSRQADGRPTRGIILSVDSSRFTYTCHFLAMLRDYHKSSLPVEVFYNGKSELPKSMREHLTLQYDVKTVDLSAENLFDDSFAVIGGYAVKPYALLATSFSEVLMADADSVLLANPDTFFEQKGYKENGTLFFQDRNVPQHTSEGGHDFIVQQMGRRNVSEKLSQTPFWTGKLKHLQESGVVVVNRSRPEVFAASLFTAWQNGRLMRETVLDRHFWGDKESFWMAYELAGLPYYMVNHSCGAIGREFAEYADRKQGFCSEHPLHFFDDQDGKGQPDPANRNGTLGKPAWFNGSLRLNKYNGEKKLLDATIDTIFAMNGTWTYYEENRRWCLTDYKQFGIHEYDLGLTLGKLGRASREGEKLTTAVVG